jgi:ATP-dependent helicase HrpA
VPALRAAFAAVREQLLIRDAERLAATLSRPRLDAARFEREVAEALARAERRQQLRPAAITWPEDLPVVQAREEIKAAIEANPVIVLCGETGSGKTTQLPKICLELGRGSRGLIGHTQPRRLAARSVATRIAQELKTPLGQLVGFETRFDRRVSEQTLVKLMTDGILLAELQRDRRLLAYDTLIIDEAHERSLNIDFLLGWLKQLLRERPELKLIITSATLDPERLAAHFATPGSSRVRPVASPLPRAGEGQGERAAPEGGRSSPAETPAPSARPLPTPHEARGANLSREREREPVHAASAETSQPAPILKVEGRAYPVDIRYRPPDPDGDLDAAVADAIAECWQPRPGDVRAAEGRPPSSLARETREMLAPLRLDRDQAEVSHHRTVGGADGGVRARLQPQGDVLVFLPGEREINELARSLPGRFPRAEVLPLYSRLPAQQQDRVFSSGHAPRIVLATNVAETSITVPGIRYVVDLGTARISRFSPRLGVQQLHVEPVAQSAANQRAGRCGRVGPGICIRLYEEADFQSRPAFTDPEILRSNLAGVILQMTALKLGEVEHFGWVDAPDARHISDAYRLLQTLGALDERRQLTPLGREIARLPLDPRIARVALAGRETATPEAVWVLAAALSVQDPHEVPPEAQTQARQQHATWRHPKSDFLTLLQLWERWQAEAANLKQNGQRKWCKARFVNYLRMTEWAQVYQQVAELLRESLPRLPLPLGEVGAQRRVRAGPMPTASVSEAPSPQPSPRGRGSNGLWKPLPPEALEKLSPELHRALLAGLIDHIGLKRPEAPEYQGPRGRKFVIFPASVLAKKAPQWVMSAQLVQTSKLFARTNAAVDPAWLETVGAHLLKRSVQDPVWNAERGEVTSTEHLSLFGLPLAKRQRHYGSTHPAEARAIFIREALVGGQLLKKPKVLLANLALIESIREKEARLRRPDLLGSDEQLAAFYDARLPAEVCTDAALRRWLHAARDGGRALAFTEADVLRPGASPDVGEQFPDHLVIAGIDLRLSYTHDPGEDADGVSFHIPQSQLFALPAEAFDWLVPGLRPALIEALIRSLPQKLRRYCTPAAEFARAVLESAGPEDGPVLAVLCRELHRMAGVALEPGDFEPDKLPVHLRPRLVLEDEHGRTLGEASGLAQLQQRHREPARAALQKVAEKAAATQAWTREGLQDWDFDALPERVALPNGAAAYPALATVAEQVNLRLFESADAARIAHRDGCRALLLMQMGDRLRDLRKTAKSRLGTTLIGRPYTAEDLAESLSRRAAQDILLDPLPQDRASYQRAWEQRGQFSRYALDLLGDVVSWMSTQAALRSRLRGLGAQPQAVADITQQLDRLFAPGFIEQIPEEAWLRIPTYLRAIGVRLDRLALKPQRDQQLAEQLRPYLERLPRPWHPAHAMLEEWRVLLFAQELKAQGGPSAERVRALLEAE